jgi:serine/threonine protein kinase
MSPEQILGKDLTLKADVFSYGIIVWEIATGELTLCLCPQWWWVLMFACTSRF